MSKGKPSPRGTVPRTCHECGRAFLARARQVSIGTGRFCSRTCSNKAKCRAQAGMRTHGMSKTATYRAWVEMKRRCGDPTRENYQDYGGRGISVCARWLERFENFLADMGERPSGTSLGRKNNDSNYEPSNCRWETGIEQCNNTRSNVFLTVNDERRTVQEWARLKGLTRDCIAKRIKHGWSAIDAVMTPHLRPTRNRNFNNRREL